MADDRPLDDTAGNLAPVITWRGHLIDGSGCHLCKLVGLGLSLYMNERGGSAFPSVRTLAADLSISERSVRKHLNEHLYQQGWLLLVKRGGTVESQRFANEWQASVPPAHGAGVPGTSRPYPRHLTPTPPAHGAAQLVHKNSTSEIDRARSGVACWICGNDFADIDDYQDHIETTACPGNDGLEDLG